MSAELVVLGAGSILPRANHGCAGYALRPRPGGPVTLLDCGPGSVRALGGVGIGVEDVERVVFSHYHPDHCLDLLALLFARRNPALEGLRELELIGPEGLGRLLEGARKMFGGWVEPVGATVRVLGRELGTASDLESGTVRFESGGLGFEAVRTLHTPDSVAWRVDLEGGALAYTGDTPETPAVADLASRVDLFVVECSFPDEHPVEGHLTPSSAARLARRADCGRLLLTHFYPDLDPADAVRVAGRSFDGPIEYATDGSRHAIAG